MNANLPSESIPGRFAHAVEEFSTRIAISAPAGRWTYAELDRRSNLIASHILEQLGENSEPVALLLDHDAPLIAAILGALKANKIYLALDPHHPPEQLAAMLASAGAQLLLADQSNLAMAKTCASEQLKILSVEEIFSNQDSQKYPPKIPGDTAAWLMFTSGSTSAPKGVWQNHRGLVQEAEAYADLAGITAEDRVSLLTSCSLSASGATLFATLLRGATLGLFQVRSQGVERLAEWLPRERITILHSVPSVFRHLARAADGKTTFATVRLVRLGGEAVLRGDVEIFRRQFPEDSRIMQSLSSTETGMICTLTMDKQTQLPQGRVAAGFPVRGVEVFLVDENNRPLINGHEGKIAVRSARLKQGYWRQPELTAEKFLPDDRDPNLRIFFSNDLGKFLPDGALEHLGRADQLVKIRGQRVVLGEVEAAMLATGLPQEVAVIAVEDASGEKLLAAFYVPRAGAESSLENFRRGLRAQLPEHMIPNHFVALEQLPLTTVGKVDRNALKLPVRPEAKAGLSRTQRPRDLVDSRLVRIWESVLHISPISRTDDFFQLGGTSLQSVEVLLHIEELFRISLPPSTLVEYSTIEKLSGRLANHMVYPSPSPLVPLREGGGGRPLFLIHSGQGDVATYGLLVRRLPGRPIYGLQSVGLQGESWPLTSVGAMARRYLPEILAKDPTGPYLLAGSCMGGMVAFELAQMLLQQGKKIHLLGLFDTGLPMALFWHEKGFKKIYVTLRTPVHEGWRMLRWKIVRALGLGRKDRVLPAYRRFIANLNGRAFRAYRPVYFPGGLVLFVTTDTVFPHGDSRALLQPFASSVTQVKIPGTRAGLFMKPAVDELARQLQSRIEAVESQRPD